MRPCSGACIRCSNNMNKLRDGWYVLCCAVLCCAVLCRAVPCRAVPCCAVLCRAVKSISQSHFCLLASVLLLCTDSCLWHYNTKRCLKSSSSWFMADRDVVMQSLQADPGVYLKHEASDMLTHSGPGSAPCFRGINHSTRAVAMTVPHDSAKSNVGTSQPESQNQNGPGNPAAAGRLDNALSINSGAAVGPAGDGPGLSGTVLESVHAEVHDLRQSLGTMLQRMCALEFNLQDIKQTGPGDQLQLTKDQDNFHPFFPHTGSNPQHAQRAINTASMPTSAKLPSHPGSRPGVHPSGSKDHQEAGGNQHSMQSMLDDLVAKPNPRKKVKAKPEAVAAVQPDVEPLDSAPREATDEHTQPVPGADQVQEVECLAAASTPEPAAGLSQVRLLISISCTRWRRHVASG